LIEHGRGERLQIIVAEHEALPKWFQMTDGPIGNHHLNALKTILTQLGVNSRGWRLYLDYGDALFAPLAAHWFARHGKGREGAVVTHWLRLLQSCEMDVLPPPELVASMSQWRVPGDQLDVVPPLFLRAAWKSCSAAQYSGDGIDEFIEAELIPLAQWFFDSGAYKSTEAGRLKVGWDSLKRLRRESIPIEARKFGSDEWPPILRKFESGPYRMLALTSESQLLEEGVQMQHCVGTYGDRCRFEPLRIFSVRYKKTGLRVATLAIKETQPGAWIVDQIKGPENSDVDFTLCREVDALLQIANRISREDLQLRGFLDLIHSLSAGEKNRVHFDR